MPRETSYEEAAELSALTGAAHPDLLGLDDDPDIADLNNPDVETLPEPSLLGAKPKPVEMFGEEAQPFGRATSPKLYASAARFPTAVQFRVWRWENGVPVGLGSIDSEAAEDDFVRAFFNAMPRPGEGSFQFRLRPIDVRGRELGKEFTLNISEHHTLLQHLRQLKQREDEERRNGGSWGRGPHGDIIVNPGGGEGSNLYAEEMGRMFEQAVEAAENRTQVLQETLEEERARLRSEEKVRVEERIGLAERSADVVKEMMERLVASDQQRSEEALSSQKQHSDMMMQTLTTVFTQQQEAARHQQELQREADRARTEQDREYHERQRQDAEQRRHRDLEEMQVQRKREGEDRKYELQRLKLEYEQRQKEAELRRASEKEEARTRLERERLELEERRSQLRVEAETRRQELLEQRRADQQDFEQRMAAAREERDRQLAAEREERDRRERRERERWEEERRAAEARRAEEQRTWERREQRRLEEAQRESERRREEMQWQMKQLEVNAQRDREHAERMNEMARLEREAQREAAAARERAERESREATERERLRAYERDQEHQERMLQLSRAEQSGGLTGITDMLGMDTPEVLARIFGAGEEGGGWVEAIPKTLGALAEAWGKAARSRPAPPPSDGRRPAAKPALVPVRNAKGEVRMIPADVLAQMQQQQLAGVMPTASRAPASRASAAPTPAPAPAMDLDDEDDDFVPDLPAEAFVPEAQEATRREVPAAADSATLPTADLAAGLHVDTVQRAKAAGLDFREQRAARKAIRTLMPELEAASPDEWIGLITEALVKDISIYTYLKAVTVYAALAEARVAPAVAEKTVHEMRASALIPDDVPYTEEDWRRLQAEAAAEESVEAAAEESVGEDMAAEGGDL